MINLFSSALMDYEALYKNGEYTDISIQVGVEPNNKIFHAHRLILCARSKYFKRILPEEQNSAQAMTLEDITPWTSTFYSGKEWYICFACNRCETDCIDDVC